MGSNIKMWPTCGQRGYITPVVLGVPISERKQKCGPHVSRVHLHGDQIETWPTCGQSACTASVVLVVPTLGRKQKRDQHVGEMAT